MNWHKYGIYGIVNRANKKIYVGQVGSTQSFAKRRNNHFSELQRQVHGNPILQSAFNKHGAENFEFIILQICNNNLYLTAYEQSILNYYITLSYGVYNINQCEVSSRRGAILSECTKLKIAASKQGSKLSEQTKKKLSSIGLGRKRPQDVKDKIRDAHRGLEHDWQYKSVESICPDTGIVREYRSIKFVEADGFSRKLVQRVCKGLRNRHRGLYWQYL